MGISTFQILQSHIYRHRPLLEEEIAIYRTIEPILGDKIICTTIYIEQSEPGLRDKETKRIPYVTIKWKFTTTYV